MKSILITGGAGSFGQQFVRYLLEHTDTQRICIFNRSEFTQAMMAEAFGYNPRLRFFLGDVRDRERLELAMYDVDVVVHAAALKRVDWLAYHITEALATNIVGTKNVVMAAIATGVSKLVLISSDKAVQPTNSYGASKQMAEHLTTGANVYGVPQGTRLASVRYGNVLGSRGSVVHIFRDAVKAGRALQITDERMTRFWITFSQAAELVMSALTDMKGGEIFIPKLPAMRVMELARAIGGPDYPWTQIGLRDGGEKLHETLLSEEELSRTFDGGTYYLVAPKPHPWTSDEWSGTLVPEGFRYSSDRAPAMDPATLQEVLAGIP